MASYVPATATAAAAPESAQQLPRAERKMSMASDDVLLKQIQATHAPDGSDFDVKLLFRIVEDIIRSVKPQGVPSAMEQTSESVVEAAKIMLEAPSYVVTRLANEIAYKCAGGVDGHTTTVSLLSLLSRYPWDAKLVLTLAAFALNYGEFWLLLQINPTNKLAKRMAILRQLPDIVEYSNKLEPFLNNLFESILDLTRNIVAFKDVPSNYVSSGVPSFSLAMSSIPIAVYWIVRSVIVCATNITHLTGMGHEYIMSTTESWELSSLEHKIRNLNEHLHKQLILCLQFIEEKKQIEYYEALVQSFETTHIDNMKVLKLLLSAKEDERPLFYGSSKTRVSLEVLRRKTVLLLISDTKISPSLLSVLELMYSEIRSQPTRIESQFDVVWLAVVDPSVAWTDEMQMKFESLMNTMEWYTVHHPSWTNPAVTRFIREKFHFKNQAIFVALDPQGNVVNQNALHMLWVWGSSAFPFTSTKEVALWGEETWRCELMVNGIDQVVLDWIAQERDIFLYGGDDVEWIRRFTTTARIAASATKTPLEMIYLGNSTADLDRLRRVVTTIQTENLSHVWDPTMIWFFWNRLESMSFSRTQLRVTDERDPILREIQKLLSYGKSESWALLCKGSQIILSGYGPAVATTLQNFEEWRQDALTKGFIPAFRQKYEEMFRAKDQPCCRIEFPPTMSRIPENTLCPVCDHTMDKFITFSCCHDN